MSPANSCAWGVFQGAITQTLLSVKPRHVVVELLDNSCLLELHPGACG